MDNIDFERLREDLIDYFGTAMMQFPMAMMDLSKVENASCEELIMIARKCKFDLSKYMDDERDYR